ncbi:MAG: cob(I)yrinic acid a,c-diamide adenosyltransferase [Patescibacteria group bacterium]|jgi:cob(I)alamin adenosyltransferase|nr:cob(I)yrinic acid a,c-diamide adenosyltransferase [Patescibacteria group bacterium]
MIVVFTGNGKGKTTAALGQALRAIGDGKRAVMYQFIKGPWISGEDKVAPAFGEWFKIIKGGKGFVGILGDKLPFEEHQEAAQNTWKGVMDSARSLRYYLIIADEFNVALKLGLISKEEVLKDLAEVKELQKVKKFHLLLTGRDADPDIIELADLVTEMREVKHPYQEGKHAEEGLEF